MGSLLLELFLSLLYLFFLILIVKYKTHTRSRNRTLPVPQKLSHVPSQTLFPSPSPKVTTILDSFFFLLKHCNVILIIYTPFTVIVKYWLYSL